MDSADPVAERSYTTICGGWTQTIGSGFWSLDHKNILSIGFYPCVLFKDLSEKPSLERLILHMPRKHQGGIVPLELMNLPDCMRRIEGMVSLYVAYSVMKMIPQVLLSLTNLQRLTLRSNHLQELDLGITALIHLRDIQVSHGCLSTFPSHLCDMVALRKISLEENCIIEIPNEIEKFGSRLEFLNMKNNLITELPLGLTRVRQARGSSEDSRLDFTCNPFTHIPSAIGYRFPALLVQYGDTITRKTRMTTTGPSP
jgi:hypothetical protein